jgi:hypothetical protein
MIAFFFNNGLPYGDIFQKTMVNACIIIKELDAGVLG